MNMYEIYNQLQRNCKVLMLNILPYSPMVMFKKDTEIPLANFQVLPLMPLRPGQWKRGARISKKQSPHQRHWKLKRSQLKKQKRKHIQSCYLNTVMYKFPEIADHLPAWMQHYLNFKELHKESSWTIWYCRLLCYKASTQNGTVLVEWIPRFPWQIVEIDLFERKRNSWLLIWDSHSGHLDI